jgi:hypothetical protein
VSQSMVEHGGAWWSTVEWSGMDEVVQSGWSGVEVWGVKRVHMGRTCEHSECEWYAMVMRSEDCMCSEHGEWRVSGRVLREVYL